MSSLLQRIKFMDRTDLYVGDAPRCIRCWRGSPPSSTSFPSLTSAALITARQRAVFNLLMIFSRINFFLLVAFFPTTMTSDIDNLPGFWNLGKWAGARGISELVVWSARERATRSAQSSIGMSNGGCGGVALGSSNPNGVAAMPKASVWLDGKNLLGSWTPGCSESNTTSGLRCGRKAEAGDGLWRRNCCQSQRCPSLLDSEAYQKRR